MRDSWPEQGLAHPRSGPASSLRCLPAFLGPLQGALYVGFTLNLFTFLTVAGIFILRFKHKHIETSYKTFLYPITPLLFLSIILFILVYIMIEKPVESLYGLGTVLLGLFVYFITNKKEDKTTNEISGEKGST